MRVYSSGKDAFILSKKTKEPRKISHPTSVGGLAINPKGKRLAATHYNGVSLWWLAAQDGQPTVLEWKGSHLQVAWSPDGDYVLTAMQEVQDGISGSAALDRALDQARLAVASAQRVLQLATDRYEGGAAAYLDVITAQQSLLASERQDVQIHGQQLTLSVALVKALGGGWIVLAPGLEHKAAANPPG